MAGRGVDFYALCDSHTTHPRDSSISGSLSSENQFTRFAWFMKNACGVWLVACGKTACCLWPARSWPPGWTLVHTCPVGEGDLRLTHPASAHLSSPGSPSTHRAIRRRILRSRSSEMAPSSPTRRPCSTTARRPSLIALAFFRPDASKSGSSALISSSNSGIACF